MSNKESNVPSPPPLSQRLAGSVRHLRAGTQPRRALGALPKATPPRWMWRPLAIAAATLALLITGFLLLRDSSFVRVDDVTITGLTGRDTPRIRAALQDAATDMTTLHVRVEQLRMAVSPYPIVKDLRVERDFPHKLRIEVIEHVPVAVVRGGGVLVPVARDGTLLRGSLAGAGVPVVESAASASGERLGAGPALDAVRLLGAAPRELRALVVTARRGRDGLVVNLRGGMRLIFGAATLLDEKWIVVARVFAAGGMEGAKYLDVSVPERPVAGPFPEDNGGAVAASQGTADPLAATATAGADPAGAQTGSGATATTGAGASPTPTP
jgi:cell division protein FtsQ